MIGFIIYAMMLFTTLHFVELPDWLKVINVVLLVICVCVSLFMWERHKEKVEKLEEEINKIKSKNEED